MNKKQFALSAAAFIVALALVSCEPLRGCAIEIGYEEQAGIQDYLTTYGENQHAIEIDYRVDEDGNRDAHVAILGLQRLALSEQTKIYDNMNFNIAPSSVSVSGSGTTGFYYYDNVLYSGVLYPRPENWSITYGASGYQPVCSTPHFTVDITMEPVNGVTYYYGGNARIYSSGGNGIFKFNASAVFQSYTVTGAVVDAFWKPASTTPRYYSYTPITNFSQYFNGYQFFISSGAAVSLPSGDVDTSRPWDYYNNVLLPYIENNYGDVVDYRDFLVFPDGYQPPAQPTTVPVARPTLPGFDYALETNGTEPPSDVNYNIPDLPGKDIAVPAFDFTQINPGEVMAPVAGGLRGIWELVGNVLTEYNLFPYVGIAVFSAIVFALLRLGK